MIEPDWNTNAKTNICPDIQNNVKSNLKYGEGGSKFIRKQEVVKIWVYLFCRFDLGSLRKNNDQQPQLSSEII